MPARDRATGNSSQRVNGRIKPNPRDRGKESPGRRDSAVSLLGHGLNGWDFRMKHSLRLTITLLGVLGFAIGAFGVPSLQECVEHAQVLAGVVSYPLDNPFRICQIKAWALPTQLSAVALYLGVSELWLCRIVSGFIVMFSYQALGLCVWLLLGNAITAAGLTVLIVQTGAYSLGITYPILVLPQFYTFGSIGLSWMVLSVMLIAAGRPRIGAFLLGLGLSVHFSLAIWTIPIVGLLSFMDDHLKGKRAGLLAWFSCGLLFSLASFVYQYSLWTDLPFVVSSEKQRFLDAVFRFWDGHRGSVPTLRIVVPRVLCALGCVSLAIIQLCKPEDQRSIGTSFFWKIILAFGVVGLAGSVASLWGAGLPHAVRQMMPSRMINFVNFVCAPLVLGLLFRLKKSLAVHLFLLVAIIGMVALSSVVPGIGMLWGSILGISLPARPVAVWPLILLAFPIALFLLVRSDKSIQARTWNRTLFLVRITTVFVLLAVSGVQVSLVLRGPAFPREPLNDVRHAFATHQGIVLTSSNLIAVQLQTRRPVLFNGGELDLLAYAPEACYSVQEILDNVYGVNFFNPHPDRGLQPTGALHRDEGRRLWQSRTVEQWQDISERFHVTTVMTYRDWNLNLPLIAETSTVRLFAIPQKKVAGFLLERLDIARHFWLRCSPNHRGTTEK